MTDKATIEKLLKRVEELEGSKDKKKVKPSCGYTGKIATEDLYQGEGKDRTLVKLKGQRIIGGCHEGRCWFAVPIGIGYQDCPECSRPIVEPVTKEVNTSKPGSKEDETESK